MASIPDQIEHIRHDYAHLPDEPLGYGDDWTSQWGWRTQFINLRLRIDRLSRFLSIDHVPSVILEQELKLIDARLDAIKNIINQREI